MDNDRLKVQNEMLTKENSEVYANLKQMETRCFELINQKNELDGIIELKQKEVDELEDQLISQTETHKNELAHHEQRIYSREREADSLNNDMKQALSRLEKEKQLRDQTNQLKIENLTKELHHAE